MTKKNLFSIVVIILSFVVYSTISPNQIQAQSFNKFAADDNTGGSTGSGGSSSGDDMIYIVAGVAVAAIIGYAIYKRTTSSDEDTTQAYTSSVHQLLKHENERFENKVKQATESVPLNLKFGIKNPSVLLPERTYIVGLSLTL